MSSTRSTPAARPCCSAAVAPAGRRCCCGSRPCLAPTAASTSTSRQRRRRPNGASPPSAACRALRAATRRRRRPRLARRSTRCSRISIDARSARRQPGHVAARRVPRRPDVREFPGPASRAARSRRAPGRRARRGSCSRRASRRARIGCCATRRRASKSIHMPPLDVVAKCGRWPLAVDGERADVGRGRGAGRGRAGRRTAPAPCDLLLDTLVAMGPGDRPRRRAGVALRARRRRSRPAAARATSSACTARAATARSRRFSASSPKRSREPDGDRAAAAAHAGLDQGLPVVARRRGPGQRPGQALHVRRSRCCGSTSGSTASPVPPTDDDIVREVGAYAKRSACRTCGRRRRRRCRRQSRPTAGEAGRAVGHHRDRLSAGSGTAPSPGTGRIDVLVGGTPSRSRAERLPRRLLLGFLLRPPVARPSAWPPTRTSTSKRLR